MSIYVSKGPQANLAEAVRTLLKRTKPNTQEVTTTQKVNGVAQKTINSPKT